jgi:hypothetical protein
MRLTTTTTVIVTAAAIFGCGVASRLAAQSTDFNTKITIAELMEAVVMPDADIVWNAVRYSSGADGDEMLGPATEEEWLNLRHGALALAEVANNLIIPGRAANVPAAAANEGELAPADIDSLIAQNRAAWIAYARTLNAAAMQTVEAIDARNLDDILEVGGAIDSACESCHLMFWYPDQ